MLEDHLGLLVLDSIHCDLGVASRELHLELKSGRRERWWAWHGRRSWAAAVRMIIAPITTIRAAGRSWCAVGSVAHGRPQTIAASAAVVPDCNYVRPHRYVLCSRPLHCWPEAVPSADRVRSSIWR